MKNKNQNQNNYKNYGEYYPKFFLIVTFNVHKPTFYMKTFDTIFKILVLILLLAILYCVAGSMLYLQEITPAKDAGDPFETNRPF